MCDGSDTLRPGPHHLGKIQNMARRESGSSTYFLTCPYPVTKNFPCSGEFEDKFVGETIALNLNVEMLRARVGKNRATEFEVGSRGISNNGKVLPGELEILCYAIASTACTCPVVA